MRQIDCLNEIKRLFQWNEIVVPLKSSYKVDEFVTSFHWNSNLISMEWQSHFNGMANLLNRYRKTASFQ